MAKKDGDVIGLADSGAPIEDKPKAIDAATAAPDELISAFRRKVVDTKLMKDNDPFSAHFIAGKDGSPNMFAFIVRKDLVKAENTKKLGLGEKVTTRKIVKWDSVPSELMKTLDPEGKADISDLQKTIREKGTKTGKWTGIEMASVSGDWDNGFTITNLVEGSKQSKIFGEKHGLGNPEESKANTLLLVKEDQLRESLGAKKQSASAAPEEPLEPELDAAALRAALAMERQAPGEIREDTSGASSTGKPANAAGGGLFGRLFGGGKSGGAAKG